MATNKGRVSGTSGSVLSPYIRAGIDGGCALCLRPIAFHVDQRGTWLGCMGTQADVPLILIPDRRVTPTIANPPPIDTTPTARTASQSARTPARTRTVDKPAPAPAKRGRPAGVAIASGPQVSYVARYAVAHAAVQRLPNHDRKVYGLIARMKTKGATRPYLLQTLNATKSTGKVDGAVRRLRLKSLIKVVPIVQGR
jgi:hypothetical protein